MTKTQLSVNRRSTGWRSATGLDWVLPMYMALIVVGSALAGKRGFTLWSQVISLEGRNPVELFLEGHPWTARYTVVWPIFEVADLLGDVDPNTVFTAVGVACTLGLMRLSTSIATSLGSTSQLVRTRASLFWLLFFLGFFGGRLVLALFGFALILEAQIALMDNTLSRSGARWRFVRMMIGIVLTAVGSGTFFVATATATIYVVARFSPATVNRRRIRRAAGLVVVVVLLWIAPPIVRKNWGLLETWDAASLLRHGFGFALLPLVVIGAILLVPAVPILLAPADGRRLLYRAALIALSGGVLGFSALAMITVPIGVLLAAGSKTSPPAAQHTVAFSAKQSDGIRA